MTFSHLQGAFKILKLSVLDTNLCGTEVRGFAKLKKSKNILEVGGWVHVPFGLKKNLKNCPKIKVLRLYNSPLLGGCTWRLKVRMHAAFYTVF